MKVYIYIHHTDLQKRKIPGIVFNIQLGVLCQIRIWKPFSSVTSSFSENFVSKV